MKSLPAIALVLVTMACHSVAQPSVEQRSAKGDWPNEPPGLSTLTDQPWTVLTGAGWRRRESTDDRVVSDATAPRGAAAVLEYVYPVGFAGGSAPATHYFGLDHRKELFVGLVWKVSSPWQGHASGVNKVQFLYAGSSDVAMVMYGPANGPYELRVMPQWPEHDGTWLTANVTHTPLTLGQWHKAEWYLKYESRAGAGDGVIRWWLDGALAGDYPAMRYPQDAGFVEYQISPTWGGVGDEKREADYYRFNRSYISGR
jgi:hypothetical protein